MKTNFDIPLLFLMIFRAFIPTHSDFSGYFSKVPPSVIYVQTGRTARFEWEIDDSLYSQRDTRFGSYSPTWYFSTSVSQTQIAFDWQRYNWKWTIARDCPGRYLNPTRVSKQSTANLVISNITSQDNGTYQCSLVLIKPGIVKTSSARLFVTVSPQFNLKPPSRKSIAEGQELSVSCTAIGPPTPNITWVNTVGHMIMSTETGSATLRIPNIRRDQNGTYECQARNNPNENPAIARTVVAVYYPPKSTVTPPSVTVNQSKEIVLRCTADGSPPPSISWTKADGVIKAGHTVAGGTLRIPDAIKTDAGKYTCTANNTYDSRQHTHNATVTVVVKYQPSILLDELKNETLNERHALHIKCEADGYPAPTIKWKTPTGSVHTGNVYKIPSVSRSNAGTYTCTASNGIGTDAMASIQVTVQYKPDISASKSSPTSRSWQNNTIRLRCFASGLPAPQISWYKPTNQQITTGVHIVPGGSEVTVLTTADQGDYGQYKCRATNILGSDEHVINVTQLFPPNCSSFAMTENDIEASSITVRWNKPDTDGGSPVTGYRVKINTKPEREQKLADASAKFAGLKKSTKYKVEVFAKNIAGYGRPCIKTITTKKLGKPAVPKLTVTLEESSGLAVKLTWARTDNNGKEITKYTIYMKEDTDAKFAKIDDVTDPDLLEYTVTKNIEYGKTYKFIVTAWNELGESEYDDTMVKSKEMPKGQKADNDKRTSGGDGSDGAMIGIAVGAVLFMLIVAVILGIIIVKKKGLLSKGFRRKSPSNRAAYDNDVDPDSGTHQAAADGLGGTDEGIPTYAAVDMTKKKKKPAQNDVQNYAVVDKSKKKRPGEIIYAELADFNTPSSGAPRQITYTGTDYADITQFHKQDEEPEPTYANFQSRAKNYTNIQGM